MTRKISYKKGEKVGNCIYLHDVEPGIYPSGKTLRKALFQCSCGNTFIAIINHVKRGNCKSCGCFSNIKHGLYKSNIYVGYRSMKSRCYNPNNVAYKHYGGRGISVCEEWRTDFKAFYDYMMALDNAMKPGYTIDRINNDGNYEPGNVRWANRSTQTANQRKRKDNTIGYTGVYKNRNKYSSRVVNGNVYNLGTYDTIEKALNARNNFITKNNLNGYKIQKYVG